MSELGEIHEKINATKEDVSYIKGKFDTLIPMLAMQSDVDQKIFEHQDKCHDKKSITPAPAISKRLLAAIIGSFGTSTAALAAVIYFLIKLIP